VRPAPIFRVALIGASTALAVAVVMLLGNIGEGAARGAEPDEAPRLSQTPAANPGPAELSALLVTSAPLQFNPVVEQVHTEASSARSAAARVLEQVPVPANTNYVESLNWERQIAATGGLSDSDIAFLIQFRASCEWLKVARRSGLGDKTARAVLDDLPSWPAFRGSPVAQRMQGAISAAQRGDWSGIEGWLLRNCGSRPGLA
jgi:hypothetical protein